ncbi:MAG: hypothetical protein ACI9CP_001571 [Cryomorphaceae bacterium]|jgi:hypothetical protein
MQDLHKVNLSKLQACDQQWAAMKPVGEKRLCEKCEKHITDFRKMSSHEIAMTHAQSEAAVCGLYSPDQLSLTTSRTTKRSLIPVASFVSLFALLSPNDGYGQNAEVKTPVEQAPIAQSDESKELEDSSIQIPAQRDSIIISGRATYLSEKGVGESVPFATILVKGTEIGTTTDFDGNYTLDISAVPDSLNDITLVFNYVGMTRQEIVVPNRESSNVNFDTVTDDNMIAYSVTVKKAPLHKRVWWKMSQPFKK